MTQPDRDSTGGQDIIDDALKLVDALQRKLIIAGVRRGVSSAVSSPPQKEDVWEEAIRQEQPEPEQPPLEQLAGIARTAAPEVAGHLGKAGMALFGALGRTWGVIERSLEEQRAESGSERSDRGTGSGRSGGEGDVGGQRPFSGGG